MAYEKTVWVNGQVPALDAEHLNKIEQGIADAVSVTPQNLSSVQQQQARENIYAAPADKFPYFSVSTGTTMEKTFEVSTDWRTYLVISTYYEKLGIWMVLPSGSVVIPIVDNSAVPVTCQPDKIHTKGAQRITIIYLGNS